MFCPMCRRECDAQVVRCPHCNVLLVESLNDSATSRVPQGAVVAWLGADPVVFSRVQAALKEAEIETYYADEHYRQMWQWQPGARYPRYVIYVSAQDATRAAEAIRDAGVPLN